MNDNLPKGYYSDEDSMWVGDPDKDKATLIITPPKNTMTKSDEEIASDLQLEMTRAVHNYAQENNVKSKHILQALSRMIRQQVNKLFNESE